MTCRGTLNKSIQCRVRLHAAQPTAKPRVLGVLGTALRFLARAWASALGVDSRCFPAIPMSARAVIELGVADPFGFLLADVGEAGYERQLSIILVVDRARFAQRPADHFRELLR